MTTDYFLRLVEQLDLWAFIGLLGQGLFASRFLVQWVHSERQGRSEIPVSFWFLSIGGGLILLAYAVQIANVVFIIGQVSGLAIYLRNLQLVLRNRARAAEVRA